MHGPAHHQLPPYRPVEPVPDLFRYPRANTQNILGNIIPNHPIPAGNRRRIFSFHVLQLNANPIKLMLHHRAFQANLLPPLPERRRRNGFILTVHKHNMLNLRALARTAFAADFLQHAMPRVPRPQGIHQGIKIGITNPRGGAGIIFFLEKHNTLRQFINR